MLTNLSAFRKRFGCHHMLTKVIEDRKHAPNSPKSIGFILLDLSKTVDCLQHRLHLCKLRTCCVSNDACKLFKSYICNRLQRVKIASTKSEWTILPKRVLQGSAIGSLLFNIFIFYEFQSTCYLYNYADDNTLSCSHSDLGVLKTQMEAYSLELISQNHKKANPSKFQSIIFDRWYWWWY